MKKTSKQDTGFVPRQIQIWKCAKPSESVRSAVKSQQQVLNIDWQLSCRKREMKMMNANTARDGHTTVIKMAERGGVPSNNADNFISKQI